MLINRKITTFVKLLHHQISTWLFGNNIPLLFWLQGLISTTRDQWAKTKSPNRNIKIYLGAPASPQAADSGFLSSGTLAAVALAAQKKFSSFGGVMLWDADAAQSK